jgi:signal transduction histidine kinase
MGWGEAHRDLAIEDLCWGKTKQGDKLWLKTTRSRIRVEAESLIVGNTIDVTGQIEAEVEVARSERELRDLSAKLIKAQEEERQRIASELHDSVGQQLSVIKFALEHAIADLSGALPSKQEEELGSIIGRVRQAVEEVRRISMDLHPSILNDLGLVITIDWLTREYRKLFPAVVIRKEVIINENDVPPAVKLAIFRVLQEACNNVAKYAHAGMIGISLLQQEGEIRFCVSDDGVGFDPNSVSAAVRQGFGLGGMKERARLTGGRLTLTAAPGAGTRIEVVWPLARSDQ